MEEPTVYVQSPITIWLLFWSVQLGNCPIDISEIKIGSAIADSIK
jgi:hypothetical protein